MEFLGLRRQEQERSLKFFRPVLCISDPDAWQFSSIKQWVFASLLGNYFFQEVIIMQHHSCK
jgi:hypothetical protein